MRHPKSKFALKQGRHSQLGLPSPVFKTAAAISPPPTFTVTTGKVTSVAGGAIYTTIMFGYIGETVVLCIFYINDHGNTGKPTLSDDAGNIYTEIDTHLVGIEGNPADSDCYLGLYSTTWDSVPTTVSINNGSSTSVADASFVVEMSAPQTLQTGPIWQVKVNGDTAVAPTISTSFNGFSMGLFAEFAANSLTLEVQPDPPYGNIFQAIQNTGSTLSGMAGFNVDTFIPSTPTITGAVFDVVLPNGAGIAVSISFEP